MKESKNPQLNYFIKKIICLVLHLLALITFVMGVTFLYTNGNFKKGLKWMNSETFEDSPAFVSLFEQDINYIFNYYKYKSVFETDGYFDLSKEVFGINMGPGMDSDYTVNDILNLAKQQGYYIDNNYQIVTIPTEVSPDNKPDSNYLLNWSSFDDFNSMSEPGDAYVTLDALTKQSLEALASYYAGYARLYTNPSNVYFSLNYDDNICTNNDNLTEENAPSFGRYAICTAENVMIDNNLSEAPTNLFSLAKAFDVDNTDNYSVIVAVDTTYPAADVYLSAKMDYAKQRDLYFYGLLLTIAGLIVMFATWLILMLMSGLVYKKSEKHILMSIDQTSAEFRVVLCAILIIILLFLAERVGSNLLHLFVPLANWDFAEKMMTDVIIYLCVFATFFSIVRSFKAHTLWDTSFLKHLQRESKLYFKNHTYLRRMTLIFAGYVIASVVLLSIIVVLCIHETSLVQRFIIIGFMLLFIAVQLIAFHHLYRSTIETDKIGVAVKALSNGDTAYQLKLEEFTGKEADMAHSINNIGHGLETALSEQVKSERLKSDLITNVSHDIRTPLTSIINYVDLIKRAHPSDPKILEYLDVLDQKSQHLKNLTEDLLEASKASSGNMPLEMADIDLVELVQQTNGEFEEKYALRNLKLISDLPDKVILICADGRHLWRVLENVYNNAYKYASEGSRVYVDITTEDNYVIFTIKNISEHALNISPDELTERFVRGDVSRATEGSGLGLSIASSLTSLQGGEFYIDIDGDYFKANIKFPIKQA